ncbi:ribonuclease H family protein [Polaribacter sp.]|uniref:ribonuclease H family protein n=1 Tax=Polaribacter sp. TaxID=1920175 RepID=UPI0025F0ECDD|nr:ribonuclease H family protein [Polaribacter sp.]
MSKKKFYVVWKGRKPGIYTSWDVCKRQIDGFEKAEYKSFLTLTQAELAFKNNYEDYRGKKKLLKNILAEDLNKYGTPNLESISVDAACAGNPGKMEYRGVLTHNKRELFKMGPFPRGTNNIGEFLALVHGLALLKSKEKEDIPIYSDSKIAMSWVRQKKCKTNLHFDNSTKELLTLIKRAEDWLQKNTIKNPILKWQTKSWGEIPADFGRK